MTGSLCDALTGRVDGQTMLESLDRVNLFVIPLDDERRWYRYHHLFADALACRLASRGADRVDELHSTASRWFAENGLLADALRHAILGGDHEHAADLVELGVADLRRRRQNHTLREWLAALPDDLVRAPAAARHLHRVEAALRGRRGRGGGVARRRGGRSRHHAACHHLHAGCVGGGGQGPGRRDPRPPRHDRGVPRRGGAGPGRCRRHRCACAPGPRAGRAGGPLRAQRRRRFRRYGGMGRRRPPLRRRQLRQGGAEPACRRHGRG